MDTSRLDTREWDVLTNEACTYLITRAAELKEEFEKQEIPEHIFSVTPEFISLKRYLDRQLTHCPDTNELGLSLVGELYCCFV